MAGTVPLNIQKRYSDRLVQMASTSPIHPQCMAKRNNRQTPIRTNHGTCTICTCGKNPLPSTRSQLQTHPDQSHEASGTASDNAHPTDNDQGNQIQTLRRRTEGLARGDPPEDNAPYCQT